MHTQQPSFGRTFLRWLLVLPAAVAGGVLGYVLPKVIYSLMGRFIGLNTDAGSIFWYILEFFASGASAGFALGFGCRMAPGHHKVVFALLVLLVCVYHIPGTLVLVAEFRLSLLVGLLGAILGIIIAASEMGEWDDGQTGQASATAKDSRL